MPGTSNYPTALDDDTSLFDVTDAVSTIEAGHHNNPKEAIKAIENLMGIWDSSVPTSLWYRLGSPTDSHDHSGATMMGRAISATSIPIPSGGQPSGGTLYDHFIATAGLHSPAPTLGQFVMGAQATVLPSSIIIPGIRGSSDIRVGGANDDEFESYSGWTNLAGVAPEVVNVTDFQSHLHLREAAAAGVSLVGIHKNSPAIPFTMTVKMTDAFARVATQRAGIFIAVATTPVVIEGIFLEYTTQRQVALLNFATRTTSPTTVISLAEHAHLPLYLRIVVNSSSSVDYYYSFGGHIWNIITTARNPGFTPGSIGFAVDSNNATHKGDAVFDWMRLT